MNKLAGLVVPIVTPYDDEGGLDFQATAALCSYLMQHNVDGFFVGGTTGECSLLTFEERQRLSLFVLQHVGTAAQVCIHVGSQSFAETLALAEHAALNNGRCIAAVTPYYLRFTREEVFQFYSRLAEQLPEDMAIYVYNIPGNTGIDIDTALLGELQAKHGNIVGIKNTMTDLHRLNEYLDLKSVDVFAGCDNLVVHSLLMGCCGTVSSNANVFPELFRALYRFGQEGAWQKALQVQTMINRLIVPLKQGGGIAQIKYSLALRGVPVGAARFPLLPLGEAEQQALQRLITDYLQTIESLDELE